MDKKLFAEVRSGLNRTRSIFLPRGWRRDEDVRTYVMAHLPKNPTFSHEMIVSDIMEDGSVEYSVILLMNGTTITCELDEEDLVEAELLFKLDEAVDTWEFNELLSSIMTEVPDYGPQTTREQKKKQLLMGKLPKYVASILSNP